MWNSGHAGSLAGNIRRRKGRLTNKPGNGWRALRKGIDGWNLRDMTNGNVLVERKEPGTMETMTSMGNETGTDASQKVSR